MALGEEIRVKVQRVRDLMAAEGLGAVLLKRQANFSWLTGGGLNLVGITTETGVVSLLITLDKKYALTSNIEAPRMRREEKLEEQGFELAVFPWYEENEAALIRDLGGSEEVGADWPVAGTRDLTGRIASLRYSLTPEEIERYRWLGDKVSLALERTLVVTRRGEKESEVVGRLCRELWSDRIDPVTLMSAADERISHFRHPIPSEKPVERFLMVSVNARKWGLIVSLTRFVHFGPVPGEMAARYRANVHIDCAFMAATRPGAEAREVLKRGIAAYREQGFPEEWKLHHQGGAIGYTGRDYRTDFKTPDIVQENQAFTWNPSLTGTKSEDTILATSMGPQPLTGPAIFPEIRMEVDGLTFNRPDILERATRR